MLGTDRGWGCLVVALAVILTLGVGGLVVVLSVVSQSDAEANDDLRQALRADPAFKLIPPDIRASLREVRPTETSYFSVHSQQLGPNGFTAVGQVNPSNDLQVQLTELNSQLQAVGWEPSGGECSLPNDPNQRAIGGIWTKQIRGRWAFAYMEAWGQRAIYALYIRAVSDPAGRTVTDFHKFEPGPLGCAH